ncbi:MAG: CHAT domain-containing protein [Anaerolineae bacterium]|nr:CHAT domain-containing protein [Anaerolineae bacterium]
MFQYSELPFSTPLERISNALPMRILMALPDYVTEDPNSPLFDLTAALSTVLRSTDWEGAQRVFQPYYWAPGWLDTDLRALPHPHHNSVPGDMPATRVDVFPMRYGTGYAILHFTGGLTNAPGGGVEMDLGAGNHISTPDLATALQRRETRLLILQLLPSETFAMGLDLANTLVGREVPAVLVIQSHDRAELNEFFLRLYFNIAHDLRLVDVVAQTGVKYMSSIQAQLVACMNTANVLRLGDFREAVRIRLFEMLDEARRLRDDLRPLYLELTDSGSHSSSEIESLFRQTDSSLSMAEQDAQRALMNLDSIPQQWNHESEGIVPLSQVARAMQTVEQQVEDLAAQNRALRRRANEENGEQSDRYGSARDRESGTPLGPPHEAAIGPREESADDERRAEAQAEWLGGEADEAAAYPLPTATPLPLTEPEDVIDGEFTDDDFGQTQPEPRVLNADFAEADGGPLSSRQALKVGEFYDLEIDVGPRRTESIVAATPEAFFPFQALPPDLDGYPVDVVFVSDDFEPSMITTQMWVPRLGGRSSPIVDGFQQTPGPIRLRLRAPTVDTPPGKMAARAYGRLNLYYENNLLQSALVDAAVALQPQGLLPDDEVLTIGVDFVLTAIYEDLAALGSRAVHFDVQNDDGLHPVRVNLMMNSNGDGGHRIVVKGTAAEASPCALAGHTPYDPLAGSTILDVARDTLFDCYFARDAAGQISAAQRDGAPAFDSNNGKTRDYFRRDLAMLAIQGSRLFTLAFADVKMEGAGCTPVQWKRNLLAALKDSSIIQVTRVASASYVFPWALVYEHPLIDSERKDWRVCPVVDEEWAEDGRRHAPAGHSGTRCKYHDEPWHAKNIICPYGFWGLKHIIEEPQSIDGSSTVADVGRTVHYDDKLDVAVSITQDAAMVDKISKHLTSMASIPDIRYVSAQPATGWKALRPNLKAPEIVYFLCHGECDGSDPINSAYLSIGPRDSDPDHRIYAVGTLGGWLMDTVDGPDPDAWAARRPLVFINGCHTNGLHPGYIVSFASQFASLGACGVLGTEVRVPLSVATEVAELFFQKIAPPQRASVGEALRQIRWELANKGNLLGLAYSLYGLADLHVETEG